MEPPRKQAKMVGWFDPPVLAQTAVHMATANVFGRHSDSRLVEALASQPQACFDYPAADSDGLWLDYVADIGDGWNATYAIAEALARPRGGDASRWNRRLDPQWARARVRW